ncbi:MAG: hypothetical protein CVU06_12895 [Bacteroidetes bacterium HGW-Bacteroidetes-22]|nr:MAG: hypothetical protein CVU06_12895 [Bacteroidetes bacterium HGW-Bacteroidetes-22]
MSHTIVYVVAGEQGSGKSTLMMQLLQEARGHGLRCGGFLARGYWNNNKRTGFDLQLIDSGHLLPFCRDNQLPGWEPLRRFFFSPEALQAGIREMKAMRNQEIDLWLIDEIGPIELKGALWHDFFFDLIRNHRVPVVVSMRPALIEEICNYFEIDKYVVHSVGELTATEILSEITARQEK